jgi:tRNA (adenine37-N6)-methyltransferase
VPTSSLDVSAIGVIHTGHTDRAATPVQSALNRHELGRVTLEPSYLDGLADLDGFDYLWLLTWLSPQPGSPTPVQLRQVPFLMSSNRREIGVFAMRGPRRPNPIGLHLVRLIRLLDDGFEFAGVDMTDGTRLLDIKPWVAPLDLPAGQPLHAVRNGWFDTVDLSAPHTPNSLRALP